MQDTWKLFFWHKSSSSYLRNPKIAHERRTKVSNVSTTDHWTIAEASTTHSQILSNHAKFTRNESQQQTYTPLRHYPVPNAINFLPFQIWKTVFQGKGEMKEHFPPSQTLFSFRFEKSNGEKAPRTQPTKSGWKRWRGKRRKENET